MKIFPTIFKAQKLILGLWSHRGPVLQVRPVLHIRLWAPLRRRRGDRGAASARRGGHHHLLPWEKQGPLPHRRLLAAWGPIGIRGVWWWRVSDLLHWVDGMERPQMLHVTSFVFAKQSFFLVSFSFSANFLGKSFIKIFDKKCFFSFIFTWITCSAANSPAKSGASSTRTFTNAPRIWSGPRSSGTSSTAPPSGGKSSSPRARGSATWKKTMRKLYNKGKRRTIFFFLIKHVYFLVTIKHFFGR